MPTLIRELATSRKISVDRFNPRSASVDYEYVITGEPGPQQAYDLLASTAPLVQYGLPRTTLDLDPQGGGVWLCQVKYAMAEGSVVGDPSAPGGPDPAPPPVPTEGSGAGIDPGITISFTTEQVRVKQAVSMVSQHVPAGFAPIASRAVIGMDKDGKIEGIDVPAPAGEVRVTRLFPVLTWDYLMEVWDVIGTTNDDNFGLFKKRELLFRGVEFQARQLDQTTGGGWSGTFTLGYNKEKLNIDIDGGFANGGITVTKKRGWEYLDVKYATTQGGDGVLLERPIQVDVLQVFPDSDFFKLQIWRKP